MGHLLGTLGSWAPGEGLPTSSTHTKIKDRRRRGGGGHHSPGWTGAMTWGPWAWEETQWAGLGWGGEVRGSGQCEINWDDLGSLGVGGDTVGRGGVGGRRGAGVRAV